LNACDGLEVRRTEENGTFLTDFPMDFGRFFAPARLFRKIFLEFAHSVVMLKRDELGEQNLRFSAGISR